MGLVLRIFNGMLLGDSALVCDFPMVYIFGLSCSCSGETLTEQCRRLFSFQHLEVGVAVNKPGLRDPESG